MSISNSTLFLVIFYIAFSFTSCENYEKTLPPSEIYLSNDDEEYEVEIDSTIIITPKITYNYGSAYTWSINEEVISNNIELEITPKTLSKTTYKFTLDNDRGTVSKEIVVQSMYKTTIEDLVLNNDTFSIETENAGYFSSNKLDFKFSNNPLFENFNGFTYSNLYGNKSDVKVLYSAFNKPINFESENFVVYRQLDDNLFGYIETNDKQNHLFKSIVVNNTYYNYSIIKNGSTEGGNKAFGGNDGKDNDWFKLTINGIDKDGTKVGSIEFFLADYTKESNKEDYIINEWTKVDLTTLGKVATLEFHLSSSDVVDNKMITPGYFCLDELKIIE